MKDKMVYEGDNVVGALMNVLVFVGTFSVMTDFAILEDIDAYRDEGMGDIIIGEPFLREVGIKAKRFEGIITLYNGDDELHALVDGKKIIITESTVRRDLQLEDAEGIDCLPNSAIFEELTRMGYEKISQKLTFYKVPQPSGLIDIVADEAVHKELGDRLVRAATTASSLEAEQDSVNITKTRSKATPNESSSLGTTSGGGPRVLDLEKTKTTQANEIPSLKRRVKKLEKKRSSRSHKLKRLYKVGLTARVESSRDEEDLGEDASKQERRINAIDADEDITLVNVQDDADNEIFDVDALTGDEVFAEQEVAAKDVNLTVDEVTLAQALAALKSVKPKVKGDVIKEPNVPVNAASAPTKDKGKGIMIEEPVKPMKKKVQIMLDEEAAKRLQAEFDEEERLAREKDEANISLTEEWDDIQAKIKADHELAQRLQAEEQEELFDVEKATLFQQLLEKRRKHIVAKRAKEQRNKPPTQAQQRKIMCTYLKNMEGKKLKDLKNKYFDSIQKIFDRGFKRVNTFVDFRTYLVEDSSKRAGEELEQESTKK
ncbi:hypothetical protein Tco_1405096 [Tanacetum coccineum]